MALTAQLKDLKDSKLSGKENKDVNNAKAAGKGSRGKNKGKGRRTSGDNLTEKYAWKLVPPGAGEPKTKKVNDKEYHFCHNHNDGKGAWVLHNPSHCHASKVNSSNAGSSQQSSNALTLAKALQAIQEEDLESSSDEE